MSSYFDFDDDSSQQSGNSTCSKFATCESCVDYFGQGDVGCLWCNVPKDESRSVVGGGLCVPRFGAQDSCEFGELQATCQEGAGWYVLVLTLSALLCCCCFLTMARKFVAMWHERWWLASGGDLAVPLLDDDGEEQQHEVIFRSSLTDSAGNASWRCPVCGFDNRPHCKHCDLCGMSSEFAEAYWKDKETSRPKGGATVSKPSETSVEEGKVGEGGDARPPYSTPDSGSGAGEEDGGSGCGELGDAARGSDSTEVTEMSAAGQGGDREGIGKETDGGDAEESEVANEPEAAAPPPLLLQAGTGLMPGGSNDDGATAPDDDDGGDDGYIVGGGVGGDGYGSARRVGASLGGETKDGEKPRAAPFRTVRRLGPLTERQKRRIWQRVIGPDGKMRWLQSLESPATLAAAAAATAAASASAASGNPPGYQPPSITPPPNASSTAVAAAGDGDNGARRGRTGARGVSAAAAAAAANASAVLRYWTSRSRERLAEEGGAGPEEDSATEPLLQDQQEQQAGAGAGAGAAAAAAVAEEAREEGESSLSAAERGESSLWSSPQSHGDERGAKREREGSDTRSDDGSWARLSSAGSDDGGGAGRPDGSRSVGDSRIRSRSRSKDKGKELPAAVKTASAAREAVTLTRRDSFGDEIMLTKCPGFYATCTAVAHGLTTDQGFVGALYVRGVAAHPLPPSATRRGQLAGEGAATPSSLPPGGGNGASRGRNGSAGATAGAAGAGALGFGLGTGPAARLGAAYGNGGWAEGTARRREARREEAASEEWIASTRKQVAKLCEVASKPFWQKHSWFLDQLKLLQVPHGGGMEAMRIEVNRKNLLEDSFAQVSAMNAGELRRWLRVQFVGEPGVDAGGLEREWFMLVCSALFDPSTGLFTPQPGNGAFAINPSSGVANEMHLEYFRFTGRVLGKLLMEHSVAPYHLSLPILKHMLGLPVAFSDLEFADAELYRNLQWLRANSGAESLGLDFTVTLESFGVKEVAELLPGGKDITVTDGNKEEYLRLRLKHRVLDGTHSQLWHLMRGMYDVIPSHLISVFDYQELELLLCGIPEIDVSEWKRCSRYLGDYRRAGENHVVIKWFWEVVEAFSEDEKARLLQFCTGSSRLPAHGFKALQSNDGSFRAFSLQSITKRDSAFPRAHTCFNKLDLPTYESKKELEECLGLCICFELTGFTID
ncbi:unnamed protein product [Ectocarpus sp. CCAP 1310/34]|nr:unnamed protein product [Ectocarpus sp. CCAP 1310/34]